jgi:hypothetical protein
MPLHSLSADYGYFVASDLAAAEVVVGEDQHDVMEDW